MSETCSHTNQYSRPRFELADVFRRYFMDYILSHQTSSYQRRILAAIQDCRTDRLGGHVYRCSECGYQRHEYNSCRDRHCPKCQIYEKLKWVAARLNELLPIPYYHAVFTMPHTLNLLALYNKAIIYDLFFNATSHALNVFAKDTRYLGAKLGFIGVLHTWGQSLNHHIHIHYIVTGGGLSLDGTRWVKLPYQKKFLFPAKAISKRVRKRFAELLRRAYYNKELVFPDELSHLQQASDFERFVNKVAWQKWNSYMKEPFAGPETVVKYIGRYTHRVAITNYRLQSIDDGIIQFRYKKYHNGEAEHLTKRLTADEFIRRFLLHIIPSGFKRIRHYGFLAPGCKKKSWAAAMELIEGASAKLVEAKSTFENWLPKLTEPLKCPECKEGIMELYKVIFPKPLVPG